VVPARHPGIDQEHSRPTDNPEFVNTDPIWQSTVNAPILPEELYPGAGYPPANFAPGGPVDHTPWDHNFGMGVGAGLSLMEVQELRGYWHAVDMGTVEAESWVPEINTEDQYKRYEADDMIGQGNSPADLEKHILGVGAPNDPDARLGKRQKRYSDRYIDRHMWDAHPTPVIPRYSRGVPERVANPDGTQIDTPYGNSLTTNVNSPDRFLQQQIRRAPEKPGQAWANDGTAPNVVGSVDQYGLTSWGL
jgi:hypothetical protein